MFRCVYTSITCTQIYPHTSIIGCSESGTLNTLSVVSLDANGNVSVKSEAVSLLRSPVTVTTMTLISSAGDCRLTNTTIQANISIITPDIEGTLDLLYLILKYIIFYVALYRK